MLPTIDKERTCHWLKFLFAWKELSPKDIQKYLSLSCVQTVYHWLEGKAIPSIDNFYALSELFGMSVDQLIFGSKEPVFKNGCPQKYRVFYYVEKLEDCC